MNHEGHEDHEEDLFNPSFSLRVLRGLPTRGNRPLGWAKLGLPSQAGPLDPELEIFL